LKVLISDFDFPDVQLEKQLFRDAGLDVVVGNCRTEEEVIAAAAGCQGVLSQYAPLNAKVFAARPEIRVVSRMGAGFDTVNTADAERFGVWVANSPDYGVGEVATHALAMAIALVRHLVFFDRDVRAGTWHYASTGALRRPRDLTLGILGLGRIGKRMAEISRAVFGRVIACDPYVPESDFTNRAARVSLDALFRESDVLSLHTPLNEETRHIVSADRLRAMKRGSFLVNTARGAVADIDAVVAALDEGTLEGAGLDVLPREPMPPNHAILRHPRVILSPHAAFYSAEGERELRRKAAQNLIDWAKTGRPTYVVVEGR
jgi:phosphoglycerate dehydrogenase-like enzyme